MNQTSIPEFYNGKSVFITGGTGFIGKVVVEKLLRSCPGIENIYLLCRSKNGKNVNDRLEEITSSPVFDLVRLQNRQAFEKINLIEGDVAMLELGMSKADQEVLKDRVSIVIHVAATIKFTEHLQQATFTNLRSVREALQLARQMRGLQSFAYISTAYTSWHDLDVKEVIGETEHEPQHIIKLCETLSPKSIEDETKVLLGKHLNTYTFTKSLAEKLVQNESKGLPVVIVRPSLVGASENEPWPGWIDSLSATTFFLYYAAKGNLRAIQHVKRNPFDVIPVDKVANMIIAAAWKTAMTKELNHPQIYHITSGAENPITLVDLYQRSVILGRQYPLNDVMWYPKLRYYTTNLGHNLDAYFLHLLPAYLVDAFAKMVGRTQSAVKTQKFLNSAYQTVKFATAQPYIFRCSNYKNILSSMSDSDKKTFLFDPRAIKWTTYADDYYLGIKKYLDKGTPVDLSVLRARVTKFKYAKYLVTASLATVSLLSLGAVGRHFVKDVTEKDVVTEQARLI